MKNFLNSLIIVALWSLFCWFFFFIVLYSLLPLLLTGLFNATIIDRQYFAILSLTWVLPIFFAPLGALVLVNKTLAKLLFILFPIITVAISILTFPILRVECIGLCFGIGYALIAQAIVIYGSLVVLPLCLTKTRNVNQDVRKIFVNGIPVLVIFTVLTFVIVYPPLLSNLKESKSSIEDSLANEKKLTEGLNNLKKELIILEPIYLPSGVEVTSQTETLNYNGRQLLYSSKGDCQGQLRIQQFSLKQPRQTEEENWKYEKRDVNVSGYKATIYIKFYTSKEMLDPLEKKIVWETTDSQMIVGKDSCIYPDQELIQIAEGLKHSNR